MARHGGGFHPWDKENPNESGLYQSKYRGVLNKERPTLTTVEIKPMFPFLLQLGVIDTFAKDRIELNATKAEMNSKLCDHIERGPCTRLHGYLRACVLTNQEHIVSLLGFDPQVYRLHTDVQYNTPTVPTAPPLFQHEILPFCSGAMHATSPVPITTSPVPVTPLTEPRPEDINARPGDVFDEKQRERLINYLSLELGVDWNRCGMMLGIDAAVLENIKSGESPDGPALKMLIQWKRQNGNLNDAELKSRLCQCLRGSGFDSHVDFITNSQDPVEVIFAQLSGHLGTRWKDLAFELDFKRSEIQVMTTPNVRSHKECAEDMLIRWSQGKHSNDVVKLKKALWHLKRKDMMTHIDQYIVRQQ